MQNMGRGVVQGGCLTRGSIYRESNLLADRQGTFDNLADMNRQFWQRLSRVGDVDLDSRCADRAEVTSLPARFTVERCRFSNDFYLFTGPGLADLFAIMQDRSNAAGRRQFMITTEVHLVALLNQFTIDRPDRFFT